MKRTFLMALVAAQVISITAGAQKKVLQATLDALQAQPEAAQPLTPLTANNIEILYDMHETLVTMNKKKMTKIFFTEVGTNRGLHIIGSIIADYARYAVTRYPGKHFKLIAGIYTLLRSGSGLTCDEYRPLIEEYDATLWPVAVKMSCAYDPINGMQELLDEIDALGYTQRIATNAGFNDYQNMAQTHPQLFKYVKQGLTVDPYVKPVIRKPALEYFENYYTNYNPERTNTVIFIDDNSKNVDAARRCGFIAILFKNPAQLRKDLRALGIPLK